MFVHPPNPTTKGSCYHDAYTSIVNTARSNQDGTEQQSAVALIVANDPDALCAGIMFAKLLQQDKVTVKMYPCTNFSSLVECLDEIGRSLDADTGSFPPVRFYPFCAQFSETDTSSML